MPIFIEVNGLNISYEQPAGFESDKPTVLLIHGACQDRQTWEYQRRFLESYKRFNSIMIDLPGHGQSEGNGMDSIEKYSDFIAGFTETLGIDELVLVGHSMGGRISQKYMINYPESVVGCLLAGTGPRIRVTKAVIDAVNNDFEYFCRMAARNSFSENAEPMLREKFYKRLSVSNRKACINDMKACNEFDVTEDLGEIDTPCMIVSGSDDVLAPSRYSRQLLREINNSKLKIIEDSGHFMMMEKYSEFNRVLQNFLDFL